MRKFSRRATGQLLASQTNSNDQTECQSFASKANCWLPGEGGCLTGLSGWQQPQQTTQVAVRQLGAVRAIDWPSDLRSHFRAEKLDQKCQLNGSGDRLAGAVGQFVACPDPRLCVFALCAVEASKVAPGRRRGALCTSTLGHDSHSKFVAVAIYRPQLVSHEGEGARASNDRLRAPDRALLPGRGGGPLAGPACAMGRRGPPPNCASNAWTCTSSKEEEEARRQEMPQIASRPTPKRVHLKTLCFVCL